MAELPTTYARRPTPKFGGVNEAAPVAPSGEDEVGRAYMGLGAAVMVAANRMQARADKDSLESLENKYREKVRVLREKVRENEGAAVGENPTFYTDFMAQHADIVNEIKSENKNARIANHLENRLQMGETNFAEGLTDHVWRQRKVWQDQIYEDGVELRTDSMASGEHIDQDRRDIERLTTNYAVDNDIPIGSDTYKRMLRENLTAGHVKRIKALVDSDQYTEARDHYNDYKKLDEIDQNAVPEIERLLDAAGREARTIDIADHVRQQDWTESEALEYARKTARKEDRDMAVQRVKQIYSEKNKAQVDHWNNMLEGVSGIYADGLAAGLPAIEAWKAVPLSMREDMKQTDRLAMMAKVDQDAAGKSVKTNWGAYFMLEDYIRNNQEDAQENLKLASYQHLIAGPELKELNRMIWKDPKELMTSKQYLDEVLADFFEIDPGEMTDFTSTEGRRARAYRRWVNDQLPADWNSGHLQEVIEASKKKIMADGGFWSSGEFYVWELKEDKEVPGVELGAVTDLIDALEEIGFEPTVENLQYAEMIRVSEKRISRANMQALIAIAERRKAEEAAQERAGSAAGRFSESRQKGEAQTQSEISERFSQRLYGR